MLIRYTTSIPTQSLQIQRNPFLSELSPHSNSPSCDFCLATLQWLKKQTKKKKLSRLSQQTRGNYRPRNSEQESLILVPSLQRLGLADHINQVCEFRWYSGKESPANAGQAGHVGSVPGLGRSPGVESVNPHQYYCLEDSMDMGARWATVHGVTKSRT